MQPIVLTEGVVRFKQNTIVRDLLDFATERGFSLNTIVLRVDNGTYPVEDLIQLDQLVGYSVSEFGGLREAPKALVRRADAMTQKLLRTKKRPRNVK